jgi:autotransporter adhesin
VLCPVDKQLVSRTEGVIPLPNRDQSHGGTPQTKGRLRSVWNKALGAFVVASELCVAQSKGRSGRTLVSSGAPSRKDRSECFGDLGLKHVRKKHLAVLLTCVFVTDAWAQLAGGTATGSGSVAAGPGSTASNTRSVAYGNTATASGVDAVSLGVFSVATGDLATAIGQAATASAINSIALGWTAVASGSNAISIGEFSFAGNSGAVALGPGASASGLLAVALGNLALSTGTSSTALGPGATASAANAVALGLNSKASGVSASALGAGRFRKCATASMSAADGCRTLSGSVHGILERLTRRELDGLRGRDPDFGAGRRIATDPRGAGARRKRAETDQLDGVALRHRTSDRGRHRVNRFASSDLAFTRRRSDGIHQFLFVHYDSLLWS